MAMTVTAIEEYPKGKGRVAVYLNNDFAFVLYKGEVKSYNIELNQELSDETYERILNEVLIKRARKRAMNLIKSIDRTESDVRRKLSEGGYPQRAVDEAIEYLKSFRYIDDLRYASEYIRFKSGTYSRKQIVGKLLEKGISKDTIEEAYNVYEEENGIDSEESERKLIEALIRKRCTLGIDNQTYDEKRKLFAYLYGKGFSVSSIEKVYSSISSGAECGL